MKRQFLAKAITLGLMLAVPLGAQAATTLTADTTVDSDVTIDNDDKCIVGNNFNYKVNGQLIIKGSKYIKEVNELSFGAGASKGNSLENNAQISAKSITVSGYLWTGAGSEIKADSITLTNPRVSDVCSLNNNGYIETTGNIIADGSIISINTGVIKADGDVRTKSTLAVGGWNGYKENSTVTANNIVAEAVINHGQIRADSLQTTLNIANGGKINITGTLNIDGILKHEGSNAYIETNDLIISQTGVNATMDSYSKAELKVKNKMTLNENANFVFEKGQDGSKVYINNLETSGNNKLTIEKDVTGVRVGTLEGNNAVIEVKSDEAGKISIGTNNSTGLTIQGTSEMTDSYGDNISGGLNKLKNTVGITEGNKETTLKLAKGSVVGDVTAQTNANGDVTGYTEAPNEDNAGISEMASIGLMAWRAENNDMNKRLGELRSSKGEHGVWTRMVRGQSKYGAQGIKNQYSTYQLGYDEKLSVDKHWTVGAAVSYTDASSSFTTGHGENKHTGLAIYGSYLGDNGSFVDLIAKAARLKNEFDVMGGAGKGDYETNGYSLSAEYGKRFTKDNGFWIEPQVELTYGYVGAVDYLTSNDVSVRQNGMDSLVGRIGFSLGRDIKAGNVYARASYLYDFDGETDVAFSKKGVTRPFKQDLGGGWWEVGVGTNISLSDATHLYFDVEKTYSGNVATPWQWNAGMRWSF